MNSTKNKKEEKSLQMLSYTEVEKKKKNEHDYFRYVQWDCNLLKFVTKTKMTKT